jgi:hypothetical protein
MATAEARRSEPSVKRQSPTRQTLAMQGESVRLAPSLPGGVVMLQGMGRRNSFNVQKVLWLLGELGVEYEHERVTVVGRESRT